MATLHAFAHGGPVIEVRGRAGVTLAAFVLMPNGHAVGQSRGQVLTTGDGGLFAHEIGASALVQTF